MHIVIVGGGKVGRALCMLLSEEDHDVTLIEKNEYKLQDIAEHADVLPIEGNGSFYDVQQQAQVDRCDMFIAATAEDEVNLISCVIAKKLGATNTIARVRNPEYAKNMEFAYEALGITRMINPEMEVAQEIYRTLQFPSALSVEPFIRGRVNFVQLRVTPNSSLNGMSMIEFRQKYPSLIACIVERGEDIMIPDGRTILREEDHFYVTGLHQDLRNLYRSLKSIDTIRSVLIVGGGRITHYLLQLLAHSRKDIKVIEQKEWIAEALAEKFSNVTIVQGDGTDQAFLLEERLPDYDCVISMTGIDEENIILSMLAAKLGVPRTITKVNRTGLLPIVDNVGLQSVITPAKTASTAILRSVRSIDNASGSSNIEALYRLKDGEVEIAQFFVRAHFRGIQTPLKDLTFKENTLVALIVRQNKLIFPTGEDQIEPGDQVIVVMKGRSAQDLNDLLH